MTCSILTYLLMLLLLGPEVRKDRIQLTPATQGKIQKADDRVPHREGDQTDRYPVILRHCCLLLLQATPHPKVAREACLTPPAKLKPRCSQHRGPQTEDPEVWVTMYAFPFQVWSGYSFVCSVRRVAPWMINECQGNLQEDKCHNYEFYSLNTKLIKQFT